MRKTFGYHHYKQFRDVALLQTIFNHSAPSITLRYIGITQEEINKSYDDFSYDSVVGQYQDSFALKKAEADNAKWKNSELSNTIKDINNKIEKIVEEVSFLREEIRNLRKVKNKTNPNDIFARKVLQNIQNYLSNGGGKHTYFCELMLTVD